MYMYYEIFQKHIGYSYEFYYHSFSTSCKGQRTQKANTRRPKYLSRSTRSSAHRKEVGLIKDFR